MRHVTALRRARFEAGLTQAALARRAQIARQVLSDLEHGRREPRLTVARALAKVLGVTPEDLFPDTDNGAAA